MLSQQLKPYGILKSEKLRFKEYDFIADDNPERTITQRVKGTVSTNTASFQTQPTIPNLLLSSKAFIKWSFSMTKKKNSVPPVDENFSLKDVNASGDIIVMKPFMAMANCTTQVKLSINGHGIVYTNPRDWQKYMGMLFCPNDYLEKYFSTAGGLFTMNRGAYDIDTGDSDQNLGSDGDPNLDKSADLTFQNYANEVDIDATTIIEFYEPLYVGPFNWGYDIKDSLPKNFWGKKMSNLIPYVRDLKYDIKFDKLTANSFHYLFGKTSAVGNEVLELVSNGLLSAELVLQWIKPKELQITHEKAYPGIHGIASTQVPFNNISMDIPDEVKLQSWYLNHNQFLVNNGIAIPNGDIVSLSIPIIHTYQVPSYIMMFCSRDKDNVDYRCLSVLRNNDALTASDQSTDINSIEANCELTSITIQINADKDAISNRFSSRELYNLTLKNAKKDFPYDFSKYTSSIVQRQADYPGNMVVLLKADDLNISKTSGRLTRDFTFQAEIELEAHAGHYVKDLDGVFVYKFHLIFLYDKYYMKIDNTGRVEYRYESVF